MNATTTGTLDAVRVRLLGWSQRHTKLARAAASDSEECYHLAHVQAYSEILYYLRAYDEGDRLEELLEQLERIRRQPDSPLDGRSGSPAPSNGVGGGAQTRRGRRHAYSTAVGLLRVLSRLDVPGRRRHGAGVASGLDISAAEVAAAGGTARQARRAARE